ncbi:MAG: endonuclease [Vicinamibacterales bacterium]
MKRLLSTGLLVASALLANNAAAQGPVGYYNPVDPATPSTLRSTLHSVIDDHIRFPYTSGSTDTWNILELADQDPANAANIVDVYKNQSLLKQGGGVGVYDREHSWPNSYGFPNDGSTNYPYTDCHTLFLCDSSYNSSRGNTLYRDCSSGCTERVTVLTNGEGGGSGVYPGNSNWRSGTGATGSWETWHGRRGDVARAQLYLDIRYEGGTHGTTGVAEPNLILTNSQALIVTSSSNQPVAYMGILSELLQWHLEDPPDDRERHRNDVVASFQTNRNPFIDHPEWVECLFVGACSVGTGYCFGDSACPCGNLGAASEGCANSLGLGATLTAMGRASIATDTVVLTGRQMPNSSALYFQGTTQTLTVFGDGLRCAGGAVIRLGTKTNVSGASQYPEAGDDSISARGQVLAPGTRYYQCWYRNAAAFCSASTFNLTNAWTINWSA